MQPAGNHALGHPVIRPQGWLGMAVLGLAIAGLLVFALSRLIGSSAASVAAPGREDPAELQASAESARAMTEELNQTWAAIFAATGRHYRPASLATYEGRTRSRCAFAVPQTGIFYCAVDQSLQVDLALIGALRREGRAGEQAAYFILAQAMGRHVQREIGALASAAMARRGADPLQSARLQARLEQQADCHAGIAASHIPALRAGWGEESRPVLLEQLASAAEREAQRHPGAVSPNPVNAASLAERANWFRRGLAERHMAACDGTEPVTLL
jgi:predicted metalloprotease